jgi:thiamine biosynthesis protein ThiS
MDITVNGKPQKVEGCITITELVNHLKLDPTRVAVERNLEVVMRESFAETILAEGDSLEIVQFVGGG